MESGNRTENRRGFVRRILGGLFAALFGVPAAATVLDPVLRSGENRWTDVAAAADVKENRPLRFTLDVAAGWEKRKAVGYLVRAGDEFLAFSARCTHLGCKVKPGNDRFTCPCHDGAFSLGGDPIGGPPDRPLERFDVAIVDGRVRVRS